MTFSEQEIKPVWDEVARLIGDGVMQLRHRGEALSVETLENIWRGSWRTATISNGASCSAPPSTC